MFFCIDCKNAWEKFWDNNSSKIVKYPHMPTYGLERKESDCCSAGALYELVQKIKQR